MDGIQSEFYIGISSSNDLVHSERQLMLIVILPLSQPPPPPPPHPFRCKPHDDYGLESF